MKIVSMFLFLLMAGNAYASGVGISNLQFDEPAFGDLADNMNESDYLGDLGAGNHYVRGFFENGDKFDAFSLQINEGMQLQSVVLYRYYGSLRPPESMSLCVSGAEENGCRGFTLFNDGNIGMDLLQFDGMTGSLAAGFHTFGVGLVGDEGGVILQSNDLLGYKFEFVVTPVPLPAPLLLMLSGLSALLGVKRLLGRKR